MRAGTAAPREPSSGDPPHPLRAERGSRPEHAAGVRSRAAGASLAAREHGGRLCDRRTTDRWLRRLRRAPEPADGIGLGLGLGIGAGVGAGFGGGVGAGVALQRPTEASGEPLLLRALLRGARRARRFALACSASSGDRRGVTEHDRVDVRRHPAHAACDDGDPTDDHPRHAHRVEPASDRRERGLDASLSALCHASTAAGCGPSGLAPPRSGARSRGRAGPATCPSPPARSTRRTTPRWLARAEDLRRPRARPAAPSPPLARVASAAPPRVHRSHRDDTAHPLRGQPRLPILSRAPAA